MDCQAENFYIDWMRWSGNRIRIASVLGAVFVAVPLGLYLLWIKATDMGNTQAARVAAYDAMLPAWMHGRGSTYLGIVCCILALHLSIQGLKLEKAGWNLLNRTVMIISILLLFLNLWTLM